MIVSYQLSAVAVVLLVIAVLNLGLGAGPDYLILLVELGLASRLVGVGAPNAYLRPIP
jgi:hypothetical protein